MDHRIKLSIKERLAKKSIKELKAIYIRMHGVDLLRGTKTEQIHSLYQSLMSRHNWNIISNNNK